MSKFQPIKELLDKSNFTVIGYLSESEHLKNELLDDINPTNVGEFGQFFDIRSKIRESKINLIEGESNNYSGYFHFDIMDFRESTYKDPKLDQNSSNLSINRTKEIRHFSENLYGMSIKQGVKVIITSPMYNSINGWDIKGGNSLMYTANLSFHITKDEIKITKNRYGLDGSIFNLIDGEYRQQQKMVS